MERQNEADCAGWINGAEPGHELEGGIGRVEARKSQKEDY